MGAKACVLAGMLVGAGANALAGALIGVNASAPDDVRASFEAAMAAIAPLTTALALVESSDGWPEKAAAEVAAQTAAKTSIERCITGLPSCCPTDPSGRVPFAVRTVKALMCVSFTPNGHDAPGVPGADRLGKDRRKSSENARIRLQWH